MATSRGERALALLDGRGDPLCEEGTRNSREGLLCLSLGHVAEQSGNDPLPQWRRSARALSKCDNPGAEGSVLVQIGLRIAKGVQSKNGGAESIDIAEEAV